MAAWERKIIEAEARRPIGPATEGDQLRADRRALAEEIPAATRGPNPLDEPVPAMSAGEAVAPGPGAPDVGAGGLQPQGPEPLHELTLGRRPTTDDSRSLQGAVTRPGACENPSAIEARCWRKAEAARRVAARQRRARDGDVAEAEGGASDPEMVEWADRLADCFYWMSTPDDASPPDISRLDDVGGCFEAVAVALALVANNEGRRGTIERAVPLLAEAQSMLRRALQRLRAPEDPDQLAAFEWVREAAARSRLYLRRSMRADDLADPSSWADLRARIVALAGEGPRARRPRSRLVARATPEPSAEVKEAARLLGGRSVVLIGGERRPEAQDALKAALEVGDVLWIETKEHQPVASFEAAIARPEVALVLLAIRWSSHAFGEVRPYCDRHGKPLVRLPGGYNPNQVAAQILSQGGERLRGG